MGVWTPRLGYARYGNIMRSTVTGPDLKTITNSATPHSPGSYVELIASTAFDAHWMDVWVGGSASSTVDTAQLLDIAIGPSFEHVIVPNLGSGFTHSFAATTTVFAGRRYRIPVEIPNGTRIGARSRGQVVSGTVTVAVDLYSGLPAGGLLSSPGCDALGADTSDSRGVTIQAGSANNKGNWFVIAASTVNPYRGFIVCPQGNSNNISSTRNRLDIGVGPDDSSTRVIIPDVIFNGGGNENYVIPNPGVYLLDTSIPQGSRVVARVMCQLANNADLALHLMGVR